ncbi:hypothetical protein COCNU_scaffold012270G000010 [Cocos nucifera]|nr:hypothetical protein [Cocos nucifera]
MTPIASQEPSRTGTPVRATTPIRSPASSRPSTPQRTAPNSNPTESADCHVDSKNTQLSEKELQMKTRREIMVLGQRLGKTNIANWASKEEETDASVSLKTVSVDQAAKSVIETRAAAWEEAEKAKYLASAATFITPPSTARSVSMRDIGTEMTPIASQEPSRTGTPVRATTPIRSPASSRPSTPQRTAPNSNPTESADCHVDSKNTQLSEKELQMKTRREIMVLGQRLGKTNIANWASKEEETDASVSLKTVSVDQAAKSVIETRAAAWEEAEKAKYLAR